MRKERIKKCLYCLNDFSYIDTRKKFCNSSCSAKFNNKGRVVTEAQREKMREALKLAWATKRENFSTGEEHSKAVGKGTKGRHQAPKSILDIPRRTCAKIFKRLNLGCCVCGWKKGTCDIHHINGRKIENPDSHYNLTYICPNCHREFHSGNLELKEKFISLVEYIGEDWREYYYG